MKRQLITFILFTFFIISCTQKKNTITTLNEVNKPLFDLLTPEKSGVIFNNIVPENKQMNILTYQYLHNGGGVSIGDINNDGLPDIYFTANYGPNHLYLNKGKLKFKEIGRSSKVGGKRGWTTGATMIDINNDGLLDIYVCYSGKFDIEKRRNELFINNGDLTFSEKAKEYGIDDPSYSSQATFFDYDRDGDLDMFLLNHPITPSKEVNFKNVTVKRKEFAGDKLYRNDNGHFIDISEQAGIIGNSIGYGLSVAAGDIDNDGWADLYVCNDYLEKDYLYINNQDGTFSEKIRDKIRHISNFSMGSDMADFNNDGNLDIMVADMVAQDNYRIKTNMSGMNPKLFNKYLNHGLHHQYMMNTLQMNNGNGTFSEVSQLAGLSSTDWSWAPLWADFDNDGLKDLLMTNGLRKEARNNDYVQRKKNLIDSIKAYPEKQELYIRKILTEIPEVKLRNYVFKNDGDIHFSDKTEDWGLTDTSFSNGAAYADLDNDGDLDLVISNIDAPAFIYKNNTKQLNNKNYIKLKIKGDKKNTSGIGTRVTLRDSGNLQMKEHYLNRGYLSSVEDILHFGLKDKKKIDTIEVLWPNGKRQLLTNITANQTLEIAYNPTLSINKKQNTKAWITEVINNKPINHKHIENDFDDFKKEILLPHKMSTLGPASAKADVNGDGLEDLFIGAAKGYNPKLYIQKKDGAFILQKNNTWQLDKQSEDIAASFFDVDNDGDLDLYVASGGNEYDINDKALQDRLYINDGQGNFKKETKALPKMRTSSGCIAAADYDNDGDIDLFVGGRIVPGTYPKAPRSYLLQNTNGTFKDVTQTIAPQLVQPGLVTTAIWTDYNADGEKDLIVTGEWMPLLILKNTNGHFINISEKLGLKNTEGWWYSIAQGDFDKDGDIDYIAGNLGLNYKYQATPNATFDVYYDDFDKNSTGDIILTYKNKGESYPLRGKECATQQMPFIKKRFKTYDAFAKANVTDILGENKLKNSLHLQAKTFASVFIENKGNNAWSIRELPRLAQLSSINDIIVKDINKDGHLDAIIAGNLYASEVETPRNDAANGLILKGDGNGDFTAIKISESGFFAPDDVKQLELLTIDKINYIVVINNNASTQFFRIN